MFQKTSYNTDHTDIVSSSRNLRNQAIDTANHHVNLYTCLRCTDQFIDDLFVCKRIHLESDVGFFACFCMVNLLFDHCKYLILQAIRCNKEMSGFFYCFSFVQCLKYIRCFQTDFHSRCHIRKICIKPAGLFVIVSCSDLCIIFYSGLCLTCDQAQFGMHFVTIQSVNHATSCFFQPS